MHQANTILQSFAISSLVLAPATLAKGTDGPGALGKWQVRRLKQNCSKAGCSQDLFVTAAADYMPKAYTFDAHCLAYGFRGEWVECQHQLPYNPSKMYIKMNAWNQTSQSYEFWMTHQYTSWEEDGKNVNVTARMELVKPTWDVTVCMDMTVVSKEYI